MTRISELYDLQDIDLEIDSRRAAISDAESHLGESEEVEAAAVIVSEREEAVQESRKALKSAEREIDELTNRIKPFEKKLYDGSLNNPKELAAIQEDIRSIQARKRVLEDKALDIMSSLEEAERALAQAKEEHAALAAAWEAEQRRLKQEIETLSAQIARLEEKREAQRAQVDGQALALYDVLRPKHQGRAVAKVERGTCGGCRISLPMSLLQRARAGANAIVQCSSCERILYVS
jgi:uncharacterized protein